MPNRPHMNPLVSLLRWSIKGMHKEHTRVPLVGLASQIFPYPFRFFFLEGRPHTIMWPTLFTGSHLPKICLCWDCILQCKYILLCNQQCMPNTLLAVLLKLWLPVIQNHLKHLMLPHAVNSSTKNIQKLF